MSDYKVGVVCYVPPLRHYAASNSFMINMRNFPTKYPAIYFSDEYDFGPCAKPENAEFIKLNGNVEVAKDEKNKLAVNNLIFFTAIRIAASKRFSHIILLENDCRVGVKQWDEVIFNEFFSKNVNAIAGGSIAIFNPSCYTRQAAARFEKFIADSIATRPCPLSITGSSNLAEKRDSCVFPNGAFAVYKIDWLIKTFPEIIGQNKTIELSRRVKTWDYAIGIKAWEEFKDNVYDMMVPLSCIYSGYGNIMSTEEERKQWLVDGRVIGVHQVKSDWAGPEPKPETDLIELETEKPVPTFDKKAEIFICTYAKDFPYLIHCLKSIKRFASGFSGVTILVPTKDAPELRRLVQQSGCKDVTVKHGYEWSKKGFVWHMMNCCRAEEWCPNADFLVHFDADSVFTARVSPETFFREGRPILRYEPYSTLTKRHPGTAAWKIASEIALPFPVENEFMRGHPFVGHRGLYAKTRELVEQKTKMDFNNYVKSTRNEYPNTFAEFPILGAVAYEHFKELYYLIDLSKEPQPDRSPYPVFQAWSHNPPEAETELWLDGIKRKITPLKIYKELGIA